MAHSRSSVEDLVECEQAEIHRHQLDDGTHASHCRADARTGEAGFRQRRVADAFGTELRQESLAYGIAAAIAADVLAHQKDILVATQRIADGLAHGVAIGEFDHCGRGGHDTSRAGASAYVKRVSCSTGSHAPLSAKVTAWAISASISASMRARSSGWIIWLASSQPLNRTIGSLCRQASTSALSR